MTETIKNQICTAKTPKAKGGLTMKDIFSAFNSGLGVRKLSWKDGYFVYLANGVLMNGNLNDRCREDSPRAEAFEFGTSPSEWEIVDQTYVLKRDIIAALPGLNTLKDAVKIASVARVLKISLK